jgi:hypothetical protein
MVSIGFTSRLFWSGTRRGNALYLLISISSEWLMLASPLGQSRAQSRDHGNAKRCRSCLIPEGREHERAYQEPTYR